MKYLNKKRKNLITILLAIVFISFSSAKVLASSLPVDVDKNTLKEEIERIYNIRSKALVTGNTDELKNCYDLSSNIRKQSLIHELKRGKYLKHWAEERNIEFKDIQSTVRIKKIYPGEENIKVSLEETYRFDYIYKNDAESKVNSFGVGIRHIVGLLKKDDTWLIYKDFYTDCFEDALQAYEADKIETASNVTVLKDDYEEVSQTYTISSKYYNREKAVAYADKYCGAAWGSGNDYKYNPKYEDFNGRGGDCTNFASQVLGDEDAGGIKCDKVWYCTNPKYGRAQGSLAWSNADKLKLYLVDSGKARIIKVGTFSELTAPLPNAPQGAVSKLQLGDLICYEKGKGNIDHFAVVTGFDSKGYPLVNSHTTDRYHVPWDLGWGNKNIRFFLLHMN